MIRLLHRELGPGLLESAYQRCLPHELQRQGLRVDSEVLASLVFKDLAVPMAYRLDLVLEGSIIVEVKFLSKVERVHRAQLPTYLRITGLKVGFILNFDVLVSRDGIIRMVR